MFEAVLDVIKHSCSCIKQHFMVHKTKCEMKRKFDLMNAYRSYCTAIVCFSRESLMNFTNKFIKFFTFYIKSRSSLTQDAFHVNRDLFCSYKRLYYSFPLQGMRYLPSGRSRIARPVSLLWSTVRRCVVSPSRKNATTT